MSTVMIVYSGMHSTLTTYKHNLVYIFIQAYRESLTVYNSKLSPFQSDNFDMSQLYLILIK